MQPSTGLYAILFVVNSATIDEIRLAFKRLSMKHHPDRGGDHAVFADITHAHDILSDPVKRKMYDETGATQDGPHPDAQAIGNLSRLLTAIINKEDVDYNNVIELMQGEIFNTLKTHHDNIATGERGNAVCEKVIKRTKAAEGHIIYGIQQGLISQNNMAIESNKASIVMLNRMLEILSDVNYVVDMKPEPTRTYWGSPQSGFGGSGYYPK